MTSTDKALLFNFLDTARRWVSDEALPGQKLPDFSDDAEPEALKDLAEGCSLQTVQNDIAACMNCGLSKSRAKTVPGEGPVKTDSILVMVIGDGPGPDEDSVGRPFVGKAGQLLDKMLQAIRLNRTDNCFITNMVKCRTPENREPGPEEITACLTYLETQISLIRPALILTLGRTAAGCLLKTSEDLTALRGRLYDYHGIPLLPTYHPDAILGDEALKRPAWEDLKLVRAELDRILEQ